MLRQNYFFYIFPNNCGVNNCISIELNISKLISFSFFDIYCNDDIFIVLDDVVLSESDIGTIKNLLSQKIVIFTSFKKDKNNDDVMLRLGFQTELRDSKNKLKCFSYNLKTYNNKRSWNNAEGWANPENFDKFRW